MARLKVGVLISGRGSNLQASMSATAGRLSRRHGWPMSMTICLPSTICIAPSPPPARPTRITLHACGGRSTTMSAGVRATIGR